MQRELSQSNFVDSEEGVKSESSAIDSPTPSHNAPVCDLSEPYASVIRSIAEKRVKEQTSASRFAHSSMSGTTNGGHSR